MQKITKTHSQLLFSDLVWGPVLGWGTNSVVVHATVPKLGVVLAVKIFNLQDPNFFHLLQAEYDLQSQLSDHYPNIAKCFGLLPPQLGCRAMMF
jgi:hypothetical protein